MRKALFLLLFVAIGSLQSCDDRITPNESLKEALEQAQKRNALLVQKTWRFYLYENKSNGTSSVIYSEKDGIGLKSEYSRITYVFKEDGTFSISNGTNTMNGKWRLAQMATSLELTSDSGLTSTYTINQFSETAIECESATDKFILIPKQ
ncbi:hypothetical protein [Flectobacillus major]|jgi:hypothetical protein|uniref:hypothetical protein n=1 Tax=Flectobacillus major TaxID=103 RepID=UPI00040D5AE1|nr:hypothetical protein [Flectobacillus major]